MKIDWNQKKVKEPKEAEKESNRKTYERKFIESRIEKKSSYFFVEDKFQKKVRKHEKQQKKRESERS